MHRRFESLYPKANPRLHADGIKAKSARGEIGETWWSKRFVSALEAFTDKNRLTRGRSYARSGQVVSLAVAAGVVTARVQGSRPRPYDVEITVDTLTHAQWEAVEAELAQSAVYVASLFAGQMPHEVEAVFSGLKFPLFPTSSRDLKTSCSCPDYANPCKHIAASYYILAEQFDADPFLIFAWRGKTKEELLSRLDELRELAIGEDSEPIVAPIPLAASIGGFWAGGREALDARFPLAGDGENEGLSLRLGAVPGDRSGLSERVRALLPVISGHARRRGSDVG